MASVSVSPRASASVPIPAPGLVDLARRAWSDVDGRARILGVAAALGFMAVLFWQNLAHFYLIWSTDDNYSHGFLVPLISLYFANEAARRGPIAIRGGLWVGASLLLVAILMRIATLLIVVGILGDYGFIVGLAGIVAVVWGIEALRRFAFALGFLFFMVPLPVNLYAVIASPLQLMVSQVASSLLNLQGIPALCVGNLITLPGDNQMFVAEACSGMRQLTGFLALTTAWAYLSERPWWHRVILIGSSIPIAMLANVIRVTLTGMISHYVNPQFTMGAFHTAEGLLMMGFGLYLLYVQSWVLEQVSALAGGRDRA